MRMHTIAFMLLACCMFSAADIPLKTEQLIYSIEAYNGKGFSATFCAAHSDTIYLLAGVENFIQPRKSLVYFWPLSNEWKLDSQRLYIPFDGFLQVEGKRLKVKTFHPRTYTYAYNTGEYETTWEVFLDEAAREEGARFEQLITDYSKAQASYQQDLAFYEQYMNTLIEEIRKQRTAGRDVSELLTKAQALSRPLQPEVPAYYVYPLRKAFVVNLPAGEYRLLFKDADGLIMEGSEKKLVVFDKRRSAGIGYDVVPGDKWTKPDRSLTPASVLYIDGTTELYVKPFFEDEYNDLYYNKLLINDARGNQHLYKWEETRQVPAARLEISNNRGEAFLVEEQAYITVQAPGSSLGYKIEKYEPEGAHINMEPNLKAFHIPVSRHDKYLKLRLLQQDNVYSPLSYRQIRIVHRSRLGFLLVLYMLLPIGAMVLVLVGRRAMENSSAFKGK